MNDNFRFWGKRSRINIAKKHPLIYHKNIVLCKRSVLYLIKLLQSVVSSYYR